MLKLGKGEGHGVLEAVENVDFLAACEDELNGMAVLLKLQERLTAHAARRCGLLNKLATGKGCDGYRLDRNTEKFESPEAFMKALDEYIDYYNNKRIKNRLKGKSPVQYRTLSLSH